MPWILTAVGSLMVVASIYILAAAKLIFQETAGIMTLGFGLLVIAAGVLLDEVRACWRSLQSIETLLADRRRPDEDGR